MDTLHNAAIQDKLPGALQQRISDTFSASNGYLQMTLNSIELFSDPKFAGEYENTQKDFRSAGIVDLNHLYEATTNFQVIQSLAGEDIDDIEDALTTDWKDKIIKIVFGGINPYEERVMEYHKDIEREIYSHIIRVQYARDLVNLQVVKTGVAFQTDVLIGEFEPDTIITPAFALELQSQIADYVQGVQQTARSLSPSELKAIKQNIPTSS